MGSGDLPSVGGHQGTSQRGWCSGKDAHSGLGEIRKGPLNEAGGLAPSPAQCGSRPLIPLRAVAFGAKLGRGYVGTGPPRLMSPEAAEINARSVPSRNQVCDNRNAVCGLLYGPRKATNRQKGGPDLRGCLGDRGEDRGRAVGRQRLRSYHFCTPADD